MGCLREDIIRVWTYLCTDVFVMANWLSVVCGDTLILPTSKAFDETRGYRTVILTYFKTLYSIWHRTETLELKYDFQYNASCYLRNKYLWLNTLALTGVADLHGRRWLLPSVDPVARFPLYLIKQISLAYFPPFPIKNTYKPNCLQSVSSHFNTEHYPDIFLKIHSLKRCSHPSVQRMNPYKLSLYNFK